MIKMYGKGVPLPALYDVDLAKKVIIMEKISGKPLIEILNGKGDHAAILQALGRSIRMLHREAVIHGDLSTNNVIISSEGDAFLIDLGLSKQEYDVEHFGIDLHVLHEILRASHPSVVNAIEYVLEGYLLIDEKLGPPKKGPGGEIPPAKMCVKRLEAIKQRVRYHSG
jgi:Kae1-associated kinase Bud32